MQRVLLRLHGKDLDPAARSTADWAWEMAGDLVRSARNPGTLNEGLMELGATVCLPAPAQPLCTKCPLAGDCQAYRTGRQGEIPRARRTKPTPTILAAAVVIIRADGAVLLDQRPHEGMWAGLWQPPTLEGARRYPSAVELGRAVGIPSAGLIASGSAVHQTTHRLFRFRVYRASALATRGGRPNQASSESPPAARWVDATAIDSVPLSSIHRRIIDQARVAAIQSDQ